MATNASPQVAFRTPWTVRVMIAIKWANHVKRTMDNIICATLNTSTLSRMQRRALCEWASASLESSVSFVLPSCGFSCPVPQQFVCCKCPQEMCDSQKLHLTSPPRIMQRLLLSVTTLAQQSTDKSEFRLRMDQSVNIRWPLHLLGTSDSCGHGT